MTAPSWSLPPLTRATGSPRRSLGARDATTTEEEEEEEEEEAMRAAPVAATFATAASAAAAASEAGVGVGDVGFDDGGASLYAQ